ncbi:hypothetical protein HQ545_04500 [Candidatus Woesearchaeota archaeon]|nr:hypothetical protein [Candidatus Woesearchaeota archaeon]
MRSSIIKSRKAVSPLIATVLLIAFAVALGAVVMNWGRGYVEDTANIARERSDTEVTCASDVDIDIVEIDGVDQICYNTSVVDNETMQFIVANKKAKTVEKIEIRLIGTGTRVPYTVDLGEFASLSTNEAKLLNMSYDDNTYGTPQQVQLTPFIKVGGTVIACPSSSTIAKNVKPCSEVFI